jgi:hypothetical protein
VALAPPSGVSVYDVAYLIASGIPARIIVPTQAIGETLSRILSNAFNWIIKPIIDGVSMIIAWIFEQIGNLLNGAYQAIVNLVYTVIINPIKALLANALNRIYEKLEGVIFIAITVPAMIMEAKNLMHNPSGKGFLLFMLKPIIGAISASLISGMIKPTLTPITIEPSTPPTVYLIPPPKELSVTPYETVTVEDYLTLEVQPPMSFRDILRIEDYLTLEALPPMSFLDQIITQDTLTLTIFPPFALTDSITINDILDIEIIPPFALTDTVTVEDTLIIGIE